MTHFIVFTGHMLDAADRAEPRFPKEKEAFAKDEICKVLEMIRSKNQQDVIGIAGGACGGDIIFHECCKALGVPSELYLGLPENEFINASVAFAGKQWVERFNQLLKTLPVHYLNKDELSVQHKSESVWEKANEWMLHSGLVNGGKNLTLIALWDGKKGDGPGGTKHMIAGAKSHNASVIIIDLKKITAK